MCSVRHEINIIINFILILAMDLEQEPGVIYLHEMTTCLLGIFW